MIGTAAKVGAGILAGAAVAGGAMFGLATKVGNTADRLLDLSSITGMSTDEIQKWERVTTVAGVSAEAMTNASQKLTKSLNAMDEKGNKSREALEGLGLSLDEVSKMNADQRMNAIVDALMAVKDPTERARLGTDLLGASWKEIAPVLDIGADRLKEVKDNANIISKEDLERANEFRIKVDQMKERVGLLALELGVKLIPIFDKLMDWIKKYMPQIENEIKYAMGIAGDAFKSVSDFIVTTVVPVFKKMADWFVTNFPAIKSAVMKAYDYIKPSFDKLVSTVKTDLMPIIMGLWDTIKLAMPGIKSIFKIVFPILVMLVKNIIDGVTDFIRVVKGIYNLIKPGLDTVARIFSTVFGGIEKVIKGVQKVLDIFNGTKMKDKKSTVTTTYTSSGTGHVPGNAQGTNNWRGGPTWVGEQGPEIIDAPKGSRIYSNDKSMAMANSTSKQPVTLQLVLQNGKAIAEYLIPDLDNLMGSKNKITGRGLGV